MSPSLRRLSALVAAAALLASVISLIVNAAPATAALSARFERQIPGAFFKWSSPALGDVDGNGTNEIVIGGMNGSLYVVNSENSVSWEQNVGAAIASSPAVGDVDGDGINEVVTGFGDDAQSPNAGGIAIFNRHGVQRCRFETRGSISPRGVFNSPAIGDVNGDGSNDIVFGSFDHFVYAVNGSCGVLARFNNTDTIWSAPALRNVDGDPEQEIFIGGDATAGGFAGAHNGGYFRSLEYNGSDTLRQRWVRTSSETFQGSAGFMTIDGRLSVVSNAGSDFCRRNPPNCSDSNRLWVFDANTGDDVGGWNNRRLDGGYWSFLAGPAVGDIDGDGRDDVVIGGRNGAPTGQVRAFLANGQQWTQNFANAEVVAQPVIVDTTGGGTPEVIVGVASQVFVLNGPNGDIVERSIAAGPNNRGLVHHNAAAAGVFGGRWAVVSASYDPADGNKGYISVYDIPNPSSAPWPMFQRNARRLGSAPTDAGLIRCGSGYWLVASDGGIFSFGPLSPFHGSAGNIRLNRPIVGMTSKSDRSGYWFVATDGGIFNYGNTKFFGSTGDKVLNQPIVGMAVRPQGDGYWLVASDGGIFAFGDAPFLGSQGGSPLNQPIVGMASTPSGNGYWLVARDGGIFTFGDAQFMGSTGDIRLNQPIVGMSARPQGDGYWFVASDGGIFSFGNAPFHGSTGNLRLNKPVVGMRATPSGDGYWFVATDGGIFAFGDAEFCGSTGSMRLNQPVVGMG